MVSRKFYMSRILLNLQIAIAWSVSKIILGKFGKEIVRFRGFSLWQKELIRIEDWGRSK